MKRVHYDLGPRISGEHGRQPTHRARLRRVRVEDVGSQATHQPDEPPGGDQVVERRDLALQIVDVDRLEPELVRHVLHRALAAADRARHERGLVPETVELATEVRDVKRRTADVEARYDAHHPHRPLLRHEPMLAAAGSLTESEQGPARLGRPGHGRRGR